MKPSNPIYTHLLKNFPNKEAKKKRGTSGSCSAPCAAMNKRNYKKETSATWIRAGNRNTHTHTHTHTHKISGRASGDGTKVTQRERDIYIYREREIQRERESLGNLFLLSGVSRQNLEKIFIRSMWTLLAGE